MSARIGMQLPPAWAGSFFFFSVAFGANSYVQGTGMCKSCTRLCMNSKLFLLLCPALDGEKDAL